MHEKSDVLHELIFPILHALVFNISSGCKSYDADPHMMNSSDIKLTFLMAPSHNATHNPWFTLPFPLHPNRKAWMLTFSLRDRYSLKYD